MAGTLLRTDWQNTVKDELSKHAQGLYETAQRGLQIVQDVPRPDPNEVLQQLQSHVEQVAQPVQDVVQFGQQQAQQVQQQLQDYATGLTQMPQPITAGGAEPFAQSRQEAAPIAGAEPAGGSLQDYARQAALRAGVDPEIFVRQIQQESGFNPRAGSPAGAQGIAQIMPQYHNVDTSDPYASLDYAANLMRSHLANYGGDYGKALAAYNAGPGAVAKYGGIPPFEETERYVRTILGGTSGQTAPTAQAGLERAGAAIGGANRDISQFGDAQLTNAEAYAACGPAAAVRFAQRVGRNPSLKEALDLAKEVGWTQQQGMAGIASQQRLMERLGVPTKLVGADVQAMAREAQSGNPVTISTEGHYFYADGYDPASGAFHVGRSGTDLRGGKEWMTQAEMEARMGRVQGALLADSPLVPSKSAAAFVGDQRPAARAPLYADSTDQQAASVGTPFQIVGDVVDRGRRAVQQVVADLQEQPSDQAVSPVPAPGFGYDPSNIRPVEPPPDLPRRQDVRDMGIPPQPTIFEQAGERIGHAVQELPESGLADQLLRSGRTRAEQAEYGVRQQEELERMLAESRARQDQPITAGDVAGAAIEGAKSLLPFGPGPSAPGPSNITAPSDIAETRERINQGIEHHPAFQDWPVPVAAGVGIMATQMLLDPNTYTTWGPLLRAGGAAGAAVTAARPGGILGGRVSGNVLGKLTASAVTNGLQNAFYEAQRPDADPLEVGKQFTLGAGFGSGLEFGVPALVKAGRAIMSNTDRLGELARSRLPAEAEAGFAMGLPTGGRAPELPLRRPAAGRQRLPNYEAGTPEFEFEAVARPLRESSEDGLLHLDLNTLPKTVLPLDPAATTSSGTGVVKANPGGAPHTDDLRALFEANEQKRDFYFDQSDQGTPTVGAHNLEEWFSMNSISSMQTNVSGQVGEAVRVMGMVRKIARDGRAAGVAPEQIRADILKAVNDYGWSGPAGRNKRIGANKGYATGISDTGGIKTPTFAGNYGSAESRLYDPGITNDIHNWRVMNVASDQVSAVRDGKTYVDTPHESAAANNKTLYRATEAIFNELGAEQGVDGYAFQSSIWDGIRAMQRGAPDAWRKWQTGDFQGAIADAKAAGVFNRPIGKVTGAPEPGEISRAMQQPGVKAALAEWGPYLKDPLPPELGIDSVVRVYPGELGAKGLPKKGAAPLRPASLEFRQGERAIAESAAPIVRGLEGENILERLGVDPERGAMPWLAVSHRVVEETPGNYVVHLHAGNVDTARYVAAEVGDALGAPEMQIHYPDYRSADMAGIKFVGDEAEVRRIQDVLAAEGLPTVRGTTGRSLQIPIYGEDDAARIWTTLQRSGIDPATLPDYNGANERILADAYPRHLEETRGRFEPTTAGRRGLLERVRGTPAEAPDFTAPGGGAEPPSVGGLRRARGEANLPLSLNLGGAAAGGYAGYAATPEDAPLEEKFRNVGIGMGTGLLGTRAITSRLRPQVAPARATEGFRAPGGPVAREAAEGVLQARAREPGPTPPRPPRGRAPRPTAEPGLTPRPPGAPEPERAGNILLPKFVNDDARQIIEEAWRANPTRFEEARRGVVSDEEVRELAETVGQNVGRITSLWKPGQAKNAETIHALRGALADRALVVQDTQAVAQKAPHSLDARNAFITALAQHAAVQEVVSGITGEAGRALRVLREPIKGEQKALALLDRLAKANKTTPEEFAEVLLNKDLTNPEDVARAARAISDFTVRDKLESLWYFALLSNPMTHIKNTVSNALVLGTRPIETLAAGAIDLPRTALTRGGKRERFMGETPAVLFGYGAAFPEGLREAYRTMRTGVTSAQLANPELAAKAEPFSGRLADLTVNVPGRALQASDALFRNMHQQGSMYQLAYRQASQEGARGKDLVDRIAHLVGNPDKKLLQAATDEGAYRVFQQKGDFVNMAGMLREKVPALKFPLPFVQTPYNVGKYALERTPLGLSKIATDPKGGGELSDRLARASVGTATMYFFYDKVVQGNITGEVPRDPTERDAFYRQGKQPYSIKVGDTWHSYQSLQPLTTLLGGVVAFHEAQEAAGEEGADIPLAMMTGGFAFGRALLDQPWLQGTQELIDLMSGADVRNPDDILDRVSQYMQRTATSPIPSIVRGLARAQDTTVRKPERGLPGIPQALAASIPGLQENAPAALTAFGEERQRPQGGLPSLFDPRNPSAATDDPLELELARLERLKYNVQPGLVGRRITAFKTPVDLTEAEQRRYQRLTGAVSQQLLNAIVASPSYEALPDSQKVEVLEKVIENVRATVRESMEPQLARRAVEEQVEQLQTRREAEQRERERELTGATP